MTKLGVRVMLGIPTLHTAKRSINWIDAMAGLQMPLGSSLGRTWIEDETIANARNLLCQAALDQGVDYLFMLGDDVLPPPNVLLVMLDKVGRKFPVGNGGTDVAASMITGVYWTKTYPPEPYLFNGLLKGSFKDWTAGEFLPVDMAGCDCLMIDTSVLRKIPKPWFSTSWAWEPGQVPSSIATEDFYFYAKARKHGFRLFVDTSLQCMHEDRTTGAMFGLTVDMPQAKDDHKSDAEEGELIADIGAGLATTPHLYANNVKVVRFDMREDTKPNFRCDIRNIPREHFGKYDRVHASHVLEHFGRRDAPEVVAHWIQLLKKDGILELHVPNVEHAMKQILEPSAWLSDSQKHYVWQQIYGDQQQEGSAWEHKNGFTKRKLEGLLSTIPQLTDVVVEDEHEGWDIKATAKLGTEVTYETLTELWDQVDEHNGVHTSNGGTDSG